MQTVRLGIIGIGNMGAAHAYNVSSGNVSGLSLAALCDTDAEKEAFCAEKYPAVPFFSDYKALLTSGCVDAVLIAVPHRLHAKMAIDALEKGLHVLVEKPVDVQTSVARRLNEVAKKSGKVFGIMFNQRSNPLFQKAKALVASGALGQLKRSVWIVTNWYRTQAYYDSGSWRATWAGEGGGVLMNQAPHNLDLWQWICGMPSSLTAFCDEGKYHSIEVEDDATIFARYPNGATGTFITTTGEYPGTNRLEIAGEYGKIVLENGVLKHWRLEESEKLSRFSREESSPALAYTHEETKQEETGGHVVILQSFTDAILHGTPLLAPGEEGINELSLSNAAYLSAWTGKEVSLPFDEATFDALLAEKASRSSYGKKNATEAPTEEYKSRWQVNW